MSENTHVAFDTDLCRANPEAAADRIAELEVKVVHLEKVIAGLNTQLTAEIEATGRFAARNLSLEAKIEQLRELGMAYSRDAKEAEAEVFEYREAARYDPMMSGEARFSGWNLSQLNRARRLSEARRSQKVVSHPDQTSPMTVGPEASLCTDCPPAGYPTDETRCSPCPLRAQDSGASS